MASPKLSVIIPVHNESANIAPLCERLLPILNRITPAWEMVFVDDGSRDDTLERIREVGRDEPRIGAVSFSRNFGKEIAIAAGLDHARGDAVVIMDADLQHPPEMIETFVERWREGYLMVYGQRTDRSDETRVKRGFAHLFYRLFARFGEIALPEGAGDFRLIDRKGVEVLRTLGEKARFSKGLYAWIGFKATGVPFVVEERQFGTSKWSFRTLFRFAFDGMAVLLDGAAAGLDLYRLPDLLPGDCHCRLLHDPDAAVRHRPARLPEPDRLDHVLLRHPAHVARHHRRICRPHLRRGETAAALCGGRADRRRGGGHRATSFPKTTALRRA